MVPGMRVQSVTFVRGGLELRVHRVVGAPAGARVRLTGWAAGPGSASHEGVSDALHGLHGWDASAPTVLRAPQGTAFTRWAQVPALTGEVTGEAVFVALASLTGGADGTGTPLHEAADLVSADGSTAEVRWTSDGTRTRVSFSPHSVEVGAEADA
jgi:hypothetical protein